MRKKNCYLAAFFYRKAGKHGMRKAIVAMAHRILVIAFCMLGDGTTYREMGGDYFNRIRPERARTRLVRRLQRLGLNVILQPLIEPPDAIAEAQPKRKVGGPCKCADRGTLCKTHTLRSRSFRRTAVLGMPTCSEPARWHVDDRVLDFRLTARKKSAATGRLIGTDAQETVEG
jgi:hypothetical protein